MRLSAAHLNVILLPLVFVIGVWVGQSRLIDQESVGQDNPRGAEIRSKLEQRTPFTDESEILVKSQDNRKDGVGNGLGNASPTAQKSATGVAEDQNAGDVSGRQFTGIASGHDPSWENDDSDPTQEYFDMTDVRDPSDESWSESYAFQQRVALENSVIEPSPQSIEADVIRSLEEAGTSPEDISSRVENVMGMILQEDQHKAEAYLSVSGDKDVP